MRKIIFIAFVSLFSMVSFAQGQSLIACGAADGNIAHSLTKTADGFFTARIALPVLRSENGLYVNIPLTEDTAFSSDLSFLNRKSEVFQKVFTGVRYLEIKFEEKECAQLKRKELGIWYCESSKPRSIGGVNISRIEFSLENQLRSNAVKDGIEVFYASFLIQVPSPEGWKKENFRSSFTYYPNGNDIACRFED